MKKVGILMIAMVLLASNAWAFRGGCGMGRGFGMNFNDASILDLSADQKAQIQTRQEVYQQEINPLRDNLFSKKMELRNLWAQARPDQTKITAKQKEIQSLQNEMQEKTTQYRLECRELLTPDQQEKLATTVAHRGGGRGWKMHGW
jgi:Spy/CpxP family protein refolding chaperone